MEKRNAGDLTEQQAWAIVQVREAAANLEFDESLHPRDENGRFGPGGSGPTRREKEEKAFQDRKDAAYGVGGDYRQDPSYRSEDQPGIGYGAPVNPSGRTAEHWESHGKNSLTHSILGGAGGSGPGGATHSFTVSKQDSRWVAERTVLYKAAPNTSFPGGHNLNGRTTFTTHPTQKEATTSVERALRKLGTPNGVRHSR